MKRSRPKNTSKLITEKQPARRSSPPASDPARAGADALRDVQSRFAAVVMRPLDDDWDMQTTAADGRPMADIVSEFIKPNDRLTSFERLALYNRQYWYRLIDAMYEDYAGVAAILGKDRFNELCKAYLTRYPSQSGMLRNLGRHLVPFIQEEPALTAPYTDMALDMARFEWAQVKAFDAAIKPLLTADDLLGKDPSQTRLNFQPYVTLLDLGYAVDKLLLAVKKQTVRGEASNASEGIVHKTPRRRSAKPERVCIVIHRLNNMVYIKRMAADTFGILQALHQGATIIEAIEAATPETADVSEWAAQVQGAFKLWMSLGWFCRK